MKKLFLLLLFLSAFCFAQNADKAPRYISTNDVLYNAYQNTSQTLRVSNAPAADSSSWGTKIGLSVAALDSATFSFYPKKILIVNDSYADTLYYSVSSSFTTNQTFKLHPRENKVLDKPWRKFYFKFNYTPTANIPYRFEVE